MELQILNAGMECREFMEEGKKKEVCSIVISPVKVIGLEGGSEVKIVNGCNLWQACVNPRCHFSAGGRKKPKISGK